MSPTLPLLRRSDLRLKTLLAVIGLLLSGLVTIQCLSMAMNKGFWLDEAFELRTTLDIPRTQMLQHGATGQMSPSPLYYVLQKTVLARVFKEENLTRRGWDWRVSLRLVSAFSVGLGCFAAFLLLQNIHLGVAFLLPILLTYYDFGIYFGAEGRPYGTWIGLSFFLYAVTLRLILKRGTRLDRVLWIVLCFLEPMTIVTTPGQLGLAGGWISLIVWLKGERRPLFFGSIGAGLLVSACVFAYYNVGHPALSTALLSEPAGRYWHLFIDVALGPLGKSKGLFRTLLFSTILCAYGVFKKREPRALLYLATGGLCLSQLLLVPTIFLLQLLSGYFIAERHFVFLVAVRTFSTAGMVALAADVLSQKLPLWAQKIPNVKLKIKGKSRLATAIYCLVFISAIFDWAHWSLFRTRKNVSQIASAYSTYCVGAVEIPPYLPPPETNPDPPGYQLNVINNAKHHNRCVDDSLKVVGKEYSDFAPEWGLPQKDRSI